MKDKYSMSSVYDDFFNTPLIKTEKEEETKAIDVKEFNFDETLDSIEDLYLNDDDKKTLEKIVKYIENYANKLEKTHINFNFIIETDNVEMTNKITDIIKNTSAHFKYLEGNGVTTYSFYDLSEEEEINKLYTVKNGIIVYKNLNAFEMYESNLKKKVIYNIKSNLLKNKSNFLVGTKDETNTFLLNDTELEDKYFRFRFKVVDPSANDICEEIISKLSNIDINDEFRINLLDYVSATSKSRDVDYISYRDNLINEISFNKEIPKLELVKSVDEIFEDLNNLVGLEKVKKTLNELVDLISLKNKTKDDLKIGDINLHMVFLGNPGTGKTTVARLICNILYDLKYIKTNKLVEVSSKDLVAEYVGQTAPKTMDVVNKAMGGVLFVDEAYALANEDGKNSYNGEAIATLIKAMEDNRDNLVVIFAGYTKEMQAFLNSNSGITSRIGYTLEFDDYTNDELKSIFKGLVKKAGFELDNGVLEALDKIIDENRNQKNFGNARFIRNVYEKTVLKHASNTKDKKKKSILKLIMVNDLAY